MARWMVGIIIAVFVVAAGNVSSLAVEELGIGEQFHAVNGPVLVESGPTVKTVRYADGVEEELESIIISRYICGNSVAALTIDDLKKDLKKVRENSAGFEDALPVKEEGLRTGFDVYFGVSGSIPAEAQTALDEVEQYLESVFTDDITVYISFSMTSMSPGVLGSTSCVYHYPSWVHRAGGSGQRYGSG